MPVARGVMGGGWSKAAAIATVGFLVLCGLAVESRTQEANAAQLGEAHARLHVDALSGDGEKTPDRRVDTTFANSFAKRLAVNAEATDPPNAGDASGSVHQRTKITKLGNAIGRITSSGSGVSAATPQSGTSLGLAEARYDNLLELDFEVTTPQTVRIVGTLAAAAGGAEVTMSSDQGPAGFGFHSSSSPNFDQTLELPPDHYHLTAVLRGGAGGNTGIGEHPNSSTSWNFELTFECGQTVTTSVVLKNDLECPGDGLIIGAPNITLNLAGFEIRGDDGADDVGIRNEGPHDGVTIKNGKVNHFGTDISLGSVKNNTLQGLEITDSSIGALLFNASQNTIKNVTFRKNTFRGLSLEGGSSENKIGIPDHPNLFEENGFGIALDQSTNNTIRGNRVQRSTASGIGLVTQSDSNRLIGNKVEHNGLDGIFVHESSSNTLKANRLIDNEGDGANVGGGSNTLIANIARDNSTGIQIVSGTGNNIVNSPNSRGNLIESNDFSGIMISGGLGTTVKSNISRGNGENGIEIIGGELNEVIGNTLDQNLNHGVLLRDETNHNTVRVNLARDNVMHGFALVDADDNDFIGNTARHNFQNGFFVDPDSGFNDLLDNRSSDNIGFGYRIDNDSTTGSNNVGSANGGGLCSQPPNTAVC